MRTAPSPRGISTTRALLPLDRATTSSICNTATDFLIVSAIATIEPQAVLDAAVPFVVCCAVGVAWVLLAFVAFAKRLLPDYWVERGVTEFGLSLGATATALPRVAVRSKAGRFERDGGLQGQNT